LSDSFFSILIWVKLQIWFPAVPYWLIKLFYNMGVINAGLAVFNLIPLPPLDGFHILAFFLPDRSEEMIQQYKYPTQLCVMFLLFLGLLSRPIHSITNSLLNGFTGIIQLFP
jgi:Zn-dependent protease